MKILVYAKLVEIAEEHLARILAACDIVRSIPGLFEPVRQNFVLRSHAGITAEGRHFEKKTVINVFEACESSAEK